MGKRVGGKCTTTAWVDPSTLKIKYGITIADALLVFSAANREDVQFCSYVAHVWGQHKHEVKKEGIHSFSRITHRLIVEDILRDRRRKRRERRKYGPLIRFLRGELTGGEVPVFVIEDVRQSDLCVSGVIQFLAEKLEIDYYSVDSLCGSLLVDHIGDSYVRRLVRDKMENVGLSQDQIYNNFSKGE